MVEASTKGAILLVTSRQAERLALKAMPGNMPLAGLVGGVAGGLSQAYLVMGLTTTMVRLTHLPPSFCAETPRKPLRSPGQNKAKSTRRGNPPSSLLATCIKRKASVGSTKELTLLPFVR